MEPRGSLTHGMMGQRAICLSLNLGRRCMRAYPSCLRMIHHTLPLPEALCQLYNKPNNFPCIDRVPSVSNSFSSSIYRQMGNGVSSDRGTYPAALGEVVLLGNLCCRRAIASWGNSLKLRFARQTQTRRGGDGSAEAEVPRVVCVTSFHYVICSPQDPAPFHQRSPMDVRSLTGRPFRSRYQSF